MKKLRKLRVGDIKNERFLNNNYLFIEHHLTVNQVCHEQTVNHLNVNEVCHEVVK